MALKQQPTLKQRIQQINAEANALIDRRVAELKKDHPNQPLPCLRFDLTSGSGCFCAIALRLIDEQESRKEGAAA